MSTYSYKDRQLGENHILRSIGKVKENTWLIGNLILQRHPDSSPETATWKDDDGSSFTLTVSPNPLPPAYTDFNTPAEFKSPNFTLLYDAGDASAVWSIGNNVVCKARYTKPGITSESTTIGYVQDRNPSFAIPEVLHHSYWRDRNFLFTRKIPGVTLDKIWANLDDHWRQKYCDDLVRIIEEMAQWKGPIGGVDGQGILENFIWPRNVKSHTPANLQPHFEELGMDCSDCVFQHADLAPSNILVEEKPETGRVNLIDFEVAGFLPKSWIRTKYMATGAFEFNAAPNLDRGGYRRMMVKSLGIRGFDHVTEAYENRRRF